ncbi:MAG: DNA methyltransferase [Armatimonadota bacterium]
MPETKLAPRPARTKRRPLNDLSGKEWVRLTKSWFVADGQSAEVTPDVERHPASFPPSLPERFIRFFTHPGDIVLDPFVGCGSTLVACQAAGRHGIGVDISPHYCAAAMRRLELLPPPEGDPPLGLEVVQADARQLADLGLPAVDFCITSPPYWNMLRTSRGGVDSNHKLRRRKGLDTHYSDDPADLGNTSDYRQYLAELAGIFRQVEALLKPERYLVVIAQNVRPRDGVMVPLAWDLARELSRFMDLRQELIWCQDQKRLGCWGFPTTYVSNVHHHYCLVLQKRA